MTNDCASQKDRIHESALEFIRWLCFGAGITILIILLLFPKDFPSNWQAWEEIALNIALIMLPAFASAILSLVRRFWILLIPALWFIVLGFSLRLEDRTCFSSILFLIAALILFISPFAVWGIRQKQPKR